ncbi:MAG: MEDS domain-containing protein [Candidatus Eremiobacteraeota bacterium]|nr:MEDS domain-containing protein [Candidatus Eremiobacteraeota bacterium]
MSEHDVVLYGNDSEALTRCVVTFIASSLQEGNAAVVIATAEHERAFRLALAGLALDPSSREVQDRLVFLNAADTLRRMGVNGHVEPALFSRFVGSVLKKLGARYAVAAYGEMVGILRAAGRTETADQLERLWSELLLEVPAHLLCGYPIDVLGSEFHPAEVDGILMSHAKLFSVLPDFASSLNAGVESTLGLQRAAAIRGMIEAHRRPRWAALPEPEASLLWLRERLPEHADEIVARAKERYQQ